MNKIEKISQETRNKIKFKLIDKLDLMQEKNHIKNLHNYFYILNYVYDNIDHYYGLIYKTNKDLIDQDRIEIFENLLKDLNCEWLIKDDIVVKDEDLIKSIEKIDLYYLHKNGFLY